MLRGLCMTRNENSMPVFTVSYNKVGHVHAEYYPDYTDALKAFNGYRDLLCRNKKTAWHVNLKLLKGEISLTENAPVSSKQCLSEFLNSGQCEELRHADYILLISGVTQNKKGR